MTTNRMRALPRAGSALAFGLVMAVASLATANVCTPVVKWIWDGDIEAYRKSIKDSSPQPSDGKADEDKPDTLPGLDRDPAPGFA